MLTTKQLDGITEIINIGVGRGAAVLCEMLNSDIVLTVPYVNVISFEGLFDELKQLDSPVVHSIQLSFHGNYKGLANIILPEASANKLASLLANLEADSSELDEMEESILIEVGNIILNSIMGSFGNILDVPMKYDPPTSFKGNTTDLLKQLDRNRFSEILLCKTNFQIEDVNIFGEIVILYEITSLDKLKSMLDNMDY